VSLLLKRLDAWATHWPQVRDALARDCGIGAAWKVRPHVFLPHDLVPAFEQRFPRSVNETPDGMPYPQITELEDVVPCKYKNWNRDGSPVSEGDAS
jgi:hypothetical protein